MGKDKLTLTVLGKSVIQHSIELFLRHPAFQGVLVVHTGGGLPLTHPALHACQGGDSRSQSVLNGLQHLATIVSGNPQVWVHDAARPCLGRAALDELVHACDKADTPAIVASRASDSIKRADSAANEQPLIAEDCNRDYYWQAQTPQIARLDQLLAAYEHCLQQSLEVTDEAGALGAIGLKVRLLACPVPNPKLTFPKDLRLIELLLAS